MTHSVLEVTNGPAKDDLLRAVTDTDDQLTTVFDTPTGALEATINQLEEQGDDGVAFTLWGSLPRQVCEAPILPHRTIAPAELADLLSSERPSGSPP